MTLEDMIDLITMHEARIRGLEVYKILFDEPNSLPPALTVNEGVFGAFTKIEDIIIRHSKVNLDITLDILENEELSIGQKASMLYNENEKS